MLDRDAIIGLYQDTDFRTEFLAGYIDTGTHQYIAEKEFNNAFGLLIADNGFNGGPPICRASKEDVKRTLLAISTYGLSFDRNAREIYLQGEMLDNGKVAINTIFGYRGMKRIISNSPLVKYHGTEIVYEDDSFTWLGSQTRPGYASTGRTQDSPLVCGFTVFSLSDGNVLCHRSTSHELTEIEQNSIHQSIDMGMTPAENIYNSAWRERCLRILTLRAAFKEYQHLFISMNPLPDESDIAQSPLISDCDDFERRLNEATQPLNEASI